MSPVWATLCTLPGRRDLLSSMLPVYRDLLDQGIKILVYRWVLQTLLIW